jgi:diguanylate cyclase (GGDEF)-like protein
VNAAAILLPKTQPQWLLLLSPFAALTADVLLILSQSNSYSGLAIVLLLPVLAQAVRGSRAGSAGVVTGLVISQVVIGLAHHSPGIVLARTLVLWGAFGAVLSAVILGLRDRLAQAQRELERAALIDPVTNLVNRRGFADAVAKRRGRRPFTIVYLDLDGFKAVNDTSGHEAGDALLTAVGRACLTVARQGDVVARFGGDEFVVFLADTDHDAGAIAASRLSQAVSAVRVGPHRARASVGHATGGAGSSVDEVIEEADRRMYAEKQPRTDRGTIAVPVPSPRQPRAVGAY